METAQVHLVWRQHKYTWYGDSTSTPGMETAQVHLVSLHGHHLSLVAQGTGCNIDKFLQIVHYCTTAKEIVATISSGR